MTDIGYGVFATFGEGGKQDFEAMNKGVTPTFLMETVLDDAESAKQCRAVYTDLERVRINIAGDPFSAPVHPVDDFYKARFADAYEHWQRTRTRRVNGTPLKHWPPATPVQIKELEAINVFSVEDLASIADVHLGRIPDGREWRKKAEDWLRIAEKMAAETEREQLRERVRVLEVVEKTGIPSKKKNDGFAAARAAKVRKAEERKAAAAVETAAQK